ncbi:hypothetical protein NHX12_019272 [Muraenolepis orangiensis]|uniref:GOLD domain-containing protein n=1 Tax=Muraenolepis orangiensis TaxID=630683 RepID=A0A9Q0IWG3_9TELE|nr:hypothetical protein NHX12_019272 [Muraenolepis orangiensis]
MVDLTVDLTTLSFESGLRDDEKSYFFVHALMHSPYVVEYSQRGVECYFDNSRLAAWANVLFLCCLPSHLGTVSEDLRTHLPKHCLVYSFITAVPPKSLLNVCTSASMGSRDTLALINDMFQLKAPQSLSPATTWTSVTIKELKATLRAEDSVVTVYRGDIMTVHVPTVPESKRVCWEFATDGYDIAFGVYFDWTPVTSRNITVHISESSDDEDEEGEVQGPVSSGDVEKGSKILQNASLGEVLPVFRQDSHLLVHAGSHDFPGEGTYMLNKSNRRCFQVHIPLPLPKLLVIFGLGEWICSEATVSVEVLVSEDVQAQHIGILSCQTRCLTWEGDWNSEIVGAAAEKGRTGVYGKILLTVCGKDTTPTGKVFGPRGPFSEDVENENEESLDQPLPSPKRILLTMNREEDHIVPLKKDDRVAENLGYKQDFWTPMKSSTSEPAPPCVHGHSATFDPDSKALFVYGGFGKIAAYRDLYILNTDTWTWKLVTKELYLFGGVHPSSHSGDKVCTNSLSIFNPADELWYKPIVEGDKPLPRHSSILLSDKLVVFGGRNTATYLNDVHILNLVPGNRMLISGGCSSIGDLQDVHVFNMGASTWSTVVAPMLCSIPRAGHALLSLGWSQQHQQGPAGLQGTLLVFGGSDCSRTIYNEAMKYEVDIPS